jgi:hypothetical protein
MSGFSGVSVVTAKRATLGVALIAIFVLVGCDEYGNTFQTPTGAPINFLAPADASAGGPAFTLLVSSVTGGFVTNTVIQWNGKTIPTTYVSASQVTATIPASLIATAGTAYVNTYQPQSGSGMNGLSNVLPFIINPPPNPVPLITSLSPTSAAAGSPSFTLTVNGASFLTTSNASGGSQVFWNIGTTQTSLPIVNITASQIQATVDSSLLVNSTSQPITATVTVYNPPLPPTGGNGGVPNPSNGGGGVSANGLPFSITPASSSTSAVHGAVAEDTPAVSRDGRYVAFTAAQGEHNQVFVRDTCEGAASGCESRTMLLSVADDGTPGSDDSRSPSMSADGRYVAFSSAAANLVSGSPAGRQVYLRDTCLGASTEPCTPSTTLVSSDANGALVGTESILPSVSASGRFVAFLAVTPSASTAGTANKGAAQTKAAAVGTNSGLRTVFVRDTCLGASNCTPKTTRISLQPGDTTASVTRPTGPALSGNSSHVALSGGGTATLFTRSVAVDDRVFLALTGNSQ